jgi:hypothetical protein
LGRKQASIGTSTTSSGVVERRFARYCGGHDVWVSSKGRLLDPKPKGETKLQLAGFSESASGGDDIIGAGNGRLKKQVEVVRVSYESSNGNENASLERPRPQE